MKKADVKKALHNETSCNIQHTGWPCNTCFHSLELGLCADKHHEIWESVLLYRGDYKNGEIITQKPRLIKENIRLLMSIIS